MTRFNFITACLQFAYLPLRAYQPYNNLPLRLDKKPIEYIETKFIAITVAHPIHHGLVRLTVDVEKRIPDFPCNYTLPTFDENDLCLGHVSFTLWSAGDRVRMSDQVWIKNDTYDCPDYLLHEFEVELTTPNHFFD